MQPVVAGLEREGYHVERVNVELAENKSKVDQFRVREIPTFVIINDGRETGRVKGLVAAEQLRRLLGTPAQARKTKPNTAPANSGKSADIPLTNLTQAERLSDQTLIERSVRIVVDDAKSRSFGTGTVIRSVPGETLVLTCAHLFQGISRQAKTTVEFFGLPERPRLGAEVLARDTEADLCIIRVAHQQVFPAARVAGRKTSPSPGQPATSVGCDNGSEPTVRHMRVTAVNRYKGAPTIECSGEPVEGRSGGGLFDRSGEVIGVCSARDPADHRGIYGGLAAIHSLLDRNKLASLYEPKSAAEPAIALAGNDSKATNLLTLPPPSAMGLDVDRDLPMPEGAEFAEVVCVIRSLDDPSAPPKVVLINRASPDFLSLLEKEQAGQTRPSTSMRLPAGRNKQPVKEEPVNAVSSDRSTTHGSGWQSARKEPRPGADGQASPPARSPVEESARWQKTWPAGASSPDGPVRR
jgi:S1-C subfamily serine protease